jgi:ribosomal protein S12 methylthiotransferase accessory factor
MDIVISFPGGKRVDAQVGDFAIRTDQPASLGGEGSAPAPFDLFLASIATCAGIYALGFCQARGLSTEGLSLTQRSDVDPETKLPRRISLELTLPPGFPEKYRTAILRAAEGCKVKKTMAAEPRIEVSLATASSVAAAE